MFSVCAPRITFCFVFVFDLGVLGRFHNKHYARVALSRKNEVCVFLIVIIEIKLELNLKRREEKQRNKLHH